MADRTKYVLGSILVTLLLSGVVYVAMPESNVKVRVDEDKSTFYVLNNSRWSVAGREYNGLFEGSSKLNRRTSGIEILTSIDETRNLTTIVRRTPYIRGPVIYDTYVFNGSVSDVELFPVSHRVDIFNASGLFYRYEVRDLAYEGVRKKLNGTGMSFGKNMKVDWQEGYRWAWVYGDGILKVQYEIRSAHEVFNVRLFDPLPKEVGLRFAFDPVKTCINSIRSVITGRREEFYRAENGSRQVRYVPVYEDVKVSDCVFTGDIKVVAGSREAVLPLNKNGKVTVISEDPFYAVWEAKVGSDRNGVCEVDGRECCVVTQVKDGRMRKVMRGCTPQQVRFAGRWWQ